MGRLAVGARDFGPPPGPRETAATNDVATVITEYGKQCVGAVGSHPWLAFNRIPTCDLRNQAAMRFDTSVALEFHAAWEAQALGPQRGDRKRKRTQRV
jgi:hypothetical protein